MNRIVSTLSLLLLLAGPLRAETRTSTSYTIVTDVTDSVGGRSNSVLYTHDASSTGLAGGASGSASYEERASYPGQLNDVIATSIELSAPQLTVNEQATLQLSADLVFDDFTTAPLDPSSITWSVQSGPLSSISASGLATAAAVYQNSPAVAQGIYQSFTNTLNLTVNNTLPDNFGAYAADGIDDDWQVLYFNQPPNANAAPLADPDHDGQNNLFEFTAGIVPTDPQSRFLINAARVPGQASQKNVVFSPRFNDRSYAVEFSTTLLGNSWSALTTFTTSDAGPQRTVTDPNATGVRKFYRVQIAKILNP